MNPARGVIDGLGFGRSYHDLWWRVAARRREVVTDWSRRHKALFIHVPKAAGLSVYASLNMDRPADTHAPLSAIAAAEPEFIADAFTFAIVRNPWDRLVSAYHYLSQDSAFPQDRMWASKRLADCPDFATFMQKLAQPWSRNQIMAWRHFLPQTAFLEVGGRVAIDQLIAFEALDDGLAKVAEHIGAPLTTQHVNRSNRGDYRRYYSDKNAALVERLYAEDIALTGARFDDGGRLAA